MELAKNQAIKTLRDGASWHGGDHKWSLPVAQPDGTYAAGEWTPTVAPSLCAKGWHLTTQPAMWWSHDGNVAAYLAEYDGATSVREGEDKIAVERCRLLRPLTKDELASCGIFTDGLHFVKAGSAYAYGSATVDFMTADHLGTLPRAGTILPAGYGFGLGVAVRLATGGATRPGSAGHYSWSGMGGTFFFVDPAQDLFAILLTQAPGQLEMLCELFPTLVYAAL